MNRRLAGVLLALAVPLALALGLAAGPAGFGWPDPTTALGRSLWLLRGTRVGAGFAVGAGLACAGVLMQALLRNPLADPYVLGVSSGGALGAAAVVLTVGTGALHGLAMPLGAFAVALLTLGLVLLLAGRAAGGGPSLYGLLLSGVIVAALLSSLLLLLVSMATHEGLRTITWWMLGSLQVHEPAVLVAGALPIGLAVLGALALARELDALTLGRSMAHHLGVRTRLAVGLGLAFATLAAATAVALAGLIGFVGLVVPHAARAIAGAGHRRLLPAAVLGGGAFLVLCDAAARTLFAPVELPVGVVTALIGGPFFLFILRRRRGRGWIE